MFTDQKRIEVITEIMSVKLVKAEDDKYLDVLFNQWYLVPFKFDWKSFYQEVIEPIALKEWAEKKEKNVKMKTDIEKAKELQEMNDLPKILEEIKVIYRKSPYDQPIDLALYVNELLW